MSTNQALESTIQITRIVRTGLDIALLLAIVGLFIHLTNLSDSHNTNLQRKKYLASILSNKQSSPSGNNSAEHLEEFHDSEESMWTSFFAWQSKTNYASGNCNFMRAMAGSFAVVVPVRRTVAARIDKAAKETCRTMGGTPPTHCCC